MLGICVDFSQDKLLHFSGWQESSGELVPNWWLRICLCCWQVWFRQKQSLKQCPGGGPCSWTLSPSARRRCCIHAPCALTGWLRAGAADGPGTLPVCTALSPSLMGKMQYFSLFPTPLTKPLCLPYYYILYAVFILDSSPSLSTQSEWPGGLPNLSIGRTPHFLSGLLWVGSRAEITHLGLYSHMELTRLPSLAIPSQTSLALSWSQWTPHVAAGELGERYYSVTVVHNTRDWGGCCVPCEHPMPKVPFTSYGMLLGPPHLMIWWIW